MKPQVPVDPEVTELVTKHREEIEKSAGQTFTTFVPKEYSTQVVAGINYFVAVEVDDGKYLHARIFRNLSKDSSLHSINYPQDTHVLSHF